MVVNVVKDAASTKLLLIDDDVELARLLSELLTQEGFVVHTHADGIGAAEKALDGDYGLVVLDVMLPHINGFDVLRQITSNSVIPIILLTARGNDVDRVTGLEAGADDYVPKPFNPRELVARVRAVLRRTELRISEVRRPTVFRVNDVILDSAARSVRRGGMSVDITTVEFDILRELLAAAGRTVTREQLAETALGRHFDPFDRSVDMHVSKLRRKLGPAPNGEERIKTIRGYGYQYAMTVNE